MFFPTDRALVLVVAGLLLCMVGEGLANDWPGVIEQDRLRFGIRMNAVVLHQLLVERDAFHEKFDPQNARLISQFPVNIFEGAGVTRPVIGRNTDTEHDNGGAARPGGFDDGLQVGLHSIRGESAQTVVAAEFQDDQLGTEVLESAADPGGTTLRGLTTNTGVNDAMFVPLGLQPGLQQSRPRLVNIYSVAGAQTVTENQHSWRICSLRNRGGK